MPFDFARNHDDPGIQPIPLSAPALLPAQAPHRTPWAAILDRVIHVAAGALVGVLLAAWLIMGVR